MIMETRNQKVVEFLNGLNFQEEIVNHVDFGYVDLSEVRNFDDLYDRLNENGVFDIEIIYYATAINYLKENDTSLRESLEIAQEYGFSLNKLSSEVLASLLATRNAQDDFYKFKNEIDEFFEELNDIEDEEELDTLIDFLDKLNDEPNDDITK